MNYLILFSIVFSIMSCRMARNSVSSEVHAVDRQDCSRDFFGMSVGSVVPKTVKAQDGAIYNTTSRAVMAVRSAGMAWLMGFEMPYYARNSPQSDVPYSLSISGDRIVGVFTGSSVKIEELDSRRDLDLMEYLRDRCRLLTWAGVRLIKSDPDLNLHYVFDLSGSFSKHSSGRILWLAQNKPPMGLEVDKERRLTMLGGVRVDDTKELNRASAKDGLEIAQKFWDESTFPSESSCHDSCSSEYKKSPAGSTTSTYMFLNWCRACCSARSQGKICEKSGYPFD